MRTLLLVLLLLPTVTEAQTAADLFDRDTLHDVQLYMHSGDLRELRERYREDEYYPADFQWNGVRVRNVGIRVRGLATRSAVKPGLRIDFNRYVHGREFLGMRALVLDNGLKDPSLIRERISMEFIRRMGQPAPRESFARVYINGVYEGLYIIVEPVDDAFLARELGDGLGYLFEHRYIDGFHAEYLGDEVDAYKRRFDAQTHELESDSTLYSPLRGLFQEANSNVDSVWRERVGWYIDLPQLITHVAIETFLAEIDGFLGYAGMANFYLYRPVATNVHRPIAWDRDMTFQSIDSPIFQRVEENSLFRRALMFADLRALYLDVLEQCARSAAQDRWLETEILRAHAVIRDAALQDALKPVTNEEFDLQTAHLLSFARHRSAFVMAEVAKAR